jgi:cysteine desulfuration protein SufE
MTLTEKQQQWIDDWSIIPDSYERLSALMDEAAGEPEFTDEERRDDLLVPGCQARVWLTGEPDHAGLCRFRGDSDAPMVRALTVFLCRLYSGHPADEVAAVEPEILERLQLIDHLTPTRRNGLMQIRARIRQLAQG